MACTGAAASFTNQNSAPLCRLVRCSNDFHSLGTCSPFWNDSLKPYHLRQASTAAAPSTTNSSPCVLHLSSLVSNCSRNSSERNFISRMVLAISSTDRSFVSACIWSALFPNDTLLELEKDMGQ